jgi:hypothetical protein
MNNYTYPQISFSGNWIFTAEPNIENCCIVEYECKEYKIETTGSTLL